MDWITIDEAAQQLGCTTRTVRRRIKAGEYDTRLVEGHRYVCLEREASTEALDLYSQLRSENSFLRSAVDSLHSILKQIFSYAVFDDADVATGKVLAKILEGNKDGKDKRDTI